MVEDLQDFYKVHITLVVLGLELSYILTTDFDIVPFSSIGYHPGLENTILHPAIDSFDSFRDKVLDCIIENNYTKKCSWLCFQRVSMFDNLWPLPAGLDIVFNKEEIKNLFDSKQQQDSDDIQKIMEELKKLEL